MEAASEPGVMVLRARACCFGYVGADVAIPVGVTVARPKDERW